MTILMLETIDHDAMAALKKSGQVVVSPSPDAHQYDLPFEDVTAIITRGLGQLDSALMAKCPNLKVIARCGAGLNNLDLEAAAEKNLNVVFAPGINAPAVAEHTLMLMLMVVRQGFASGLEVRNDNWACRDQFSGDDLAGKRICIVGGGKIGGKVAQLCRGFSMDVVICGRNGDGIDGLRAALKKNLPVSNVISLHIPLTADTRHLFGHAFLSLLSPGTVLINTARGELVDPIAVVQALDSGKLSGYGADVIDGEPPQLDDIVVRHKKSVITPHVAAMTKRTYREMSLFTAKNVLSILSGQSPDPASLYRGAA